MNKLVSIIIPLYNVESYLDKCINSIINQTYHNLEIIIVDDGSTDSTPAVIEKFMQQDSRIVSLQGGHQGTAAARKLGIQHAHGDYLTFVDGDDWLDEDSIEVMVAGFSSSLCDIVVAQHRRIFIEEKVRYEYKDDYPFDSTDALSFIDIINERKDFTLWAKMFKKELFDNIIFHEGIPIGQDGLVLKQLVLKASSIKAINTIVYNYLYRVGSAMRKSAELVNKLHFLRGNFNNLPYYDGPMYEKERDRLVSYWVGLGIYYLRMNLTERNLYMRIWNENIYPNGLHKEYKKSNPNAMDLEYIRKFPKFYSLFQMVPIFFNLLLKKIKS